MSNHDYEQHELRECLRGSAGGRATVKRHGHEYMEEIGRIGGNAYMEKYGLAHMQEKAAKARAAKLHKRYTQPRTIEDVWAGGKLLRRARVVPYRPRGSRRKKPDLIITDCEIEETTD